MFFPDIALPGYNAFPLFTDPRYNTLCPAQHGGEPALFYAIIVLVFLLRASTEPQTNCKFVIYPKKI